MHKLCTSCYSETILAHVIVVICCRKSLPIPKLPKQKMLHLGSAWDFSSLCHWKTFSNLQTIYKIASENKEPTHYNGDVAIFKHTRAS